jgi:hypothetical protein
MLGAAIPSGHRNFTNAPAGHFSWKEDTLPMQNAQDLTLVPKWTHDLGKFRSEYPQHRLSFQSEAETKVLPDIRDQFALLIKRKLEAVRGPSVQSAYHLVCRFLRRRHTASRVPKHPKNEF